MNCIFCQEPEIKERIVLKSDLAFAFLTNIPITPGHTLVCPTRHVQSYEEMTDEEKSAVEKLRAEVKSALSKAFGSEGFNYAFNEGKVAGQTVPHFHLHVVPRKEGDKGIHNYDPRQFLYRPGSREESTTDDLKPVLDLIKRGL